MDTNYYSYDAAPPPRRRRRRNTGLVPVVMLSLVLAVLTGLAVRISVFGKIAQIDAEETEPSSTVSTVLQLPETVKLNSMNLPSGASIEPEALVKGLEDTGISVAFANEFALDVMGEQKIDLLFTREGAECVRSVTVNRFQLVNEVSSAMGSQIIPTIRDFIPDESIEAVFKGDSPETLPVDSCGIHSLTIECDGREYSVVYLVTEDIPPEGVGLTVTTEAGTLPEPESLVDEIVDHSDVTVTYEEIPELTTVGLWEVQMLLTDAFGNSSSVTAKIEVIPAENGPQFTGLEDLHIQVGGTISYKAGVSVTDRQDGDLTFSVDPGDVDNKKTGIYTAYYTATDSDGNTLTVPRTIVIQDEAETATEEYAKAVLNKIIKDDMTRDQQIYQVYLYTRKNVQFVGSSDKSSIVHAAYEGFTTGKGDCYTYYAMNVIMLDLLGIENLEVARVGGTSNHWWNLVLHDDGLYYHVDSCPKSIYLDGQTYYKLTDSDLDVYTNNKQVAAHRPNYYTYDKTLPEYQDIEIAP